MHKALRRVGGQSLIERNLIKVCQSGFQNIWVAVSHAEPALLEWLSSRGWDIAQQSQAKLMLLIEETALGTIGAAGLLADKPGDLLVINVDNLTGIEFKSLMTEHASRRVCMTIAVHQQAFQIPFGRIESTGGFLDSYSEKPFLPVTISSGVYVLADRARRMIPGFTSMNVPDLVHRLKGAGDHIFCYRHDTIWIDINDEAALAYANTVFGPALPVAPV